MSDADKNVNDPARLWKLRDLRILDTAPEASFDDIVKIASALCGTPIALVSLVDAHRQWFKAKVGLELPETPINQAVCANALGGPQILEIPDLTTDPRTRENTLVTPDDGIRFYAGAPLQTQDGLVIGTLCVIDATPRPEGLTEYQREGLLALGRQTTRMIEMRKTVMDRELAAIRANRRNEIYKVRAQRTEEEKQQLAQIHTRHRSAEEAGRIGTFEIDAGTDTLRVSAEFCRLFGVPEAETYFAEEIEQLVHPDDRKIASSASSRANGKAPPDVDYRIFRKSDGVPRWIARRASFEFDDNGKPLKMLGTVHDVTQRMEATARMRALLQLSDRLHVAESIEEAVSAGAETLGKALNTIRAGYASVDLISDRVTVEQDWTVDGYASVRGWRPAIQYAETMKKLREGQPVAFPDIRALSWMKNEVPGYQAVGAIAQIWVPVMVRGVLVGILFAQHPTPREWTKDEIEYAESIAYRTYATIAKLQAEADQQLLNQELSHRLKNMLAMIVALATQSLKKVTERDAVTAFENRLMALSSAHDDLLQQNWTGASIAVIAKGIISKLGQNERIHLSGPDINLGPRASLSLSLILHELMTNALKYGALSNDTGSVEVTWEKMGDSDVQMLLLRWEEKNGPPVTKPERKSFGSQLIELGLLGTGDAVVTFNDHGVTAQFSAPLDLAQHA